MSAAAFFQRASNIGAETNIGLIGQVLSTGSAKRSYTGSNERPQAAQVTTMTVPASPDNSTLYSVTVDGVTASYTTDASATQAELGAGLVAALLSNPSIRRTCVASYSGGTLTLTGTWPNVSFTVTNNAADTTNDLGTVTTATASAAAARVYFGRVLASDGTVTNEATPKVFLPTTSLFSNQQQTVTFASVASGDNIVTVTRMNGAVSRVSTPYNSSHAQTLIDHAANLETDFNAKFGAGRGVVAARSSDDITITTDIKGAYFESTTTVVGSGGGSQSTAETTPASISTSLAHAFAGVSARRLDVENETIDGDDPSYGPNEGVEVLSRGAIVMARSTSETWDLNSGLWVDLTTVLTSAGKVYDTPANATSPVYLSREHLRIERQEPSSQSNGVGVARVVSTAIGA